MDVSKDSVTRLDTGSPARLDPSSDARRSVTSSDFDDGGFTPGTLLLGRYRIVGLIGRGGMGEVYRAQDLKLGQSVALKILPESVQRDPSRLERFLNEVRIARQISHPNVCRVYDVADVDGRHFLSMEFVDGEDLGSLLRRIGRLPADKGVEVARQICAGLAAAHDRGVLHRDLKPANIMIDGRGHARLADFGLAAVGEELRAEGEFAGTPAYMAPEQFEGREISTRTDIYALGLVLHELFTGKRVFEGSSIQELRDAHRKRSATRPSLSSSTVDLDPAIERVIERCLDPDPQRRPASALAVAAALPGGDPLAAALAAGETPSPELVAESGSVGGLAPAVAWSLLVLFLAGVVGCAWFAHHVRFYRMAPSMRSPEVLASRAEDLLDKAGLGDLRADRAYGWLVNPEVAAYVRERDSSSDRWEKLAAADGPVIQHWYRQSPRPLVPLDFLSDVELTDPPLVTPGMATIVMTSRGRLLRFESVPRAHNGDTARDSAPVDWQPFFAAAALDPSRLKAVEPRWTPPTYGDSRAAWEGTHPGRPDWAIRVEAAAHGSRPVWFRVLGPWNKPPTEAAPARDLASTVRQMIQVGVGVMALVVGGWLARRNMRAGRADVRGARIIGLFTGVPLVLAWLFGDHPGEAQIEWARFTVLLGQALYWGGLTVLVYLALEPYVRRRWPESLISWTRLLSGRLRDPLVGRDVLIGCTAGIFVAVLGDALQSAAEWTGHAPVTPLSGSNALDALATVGSFLSALMTRSTRILGEGLLILFIVLMLHAVLRNRWAALAALAALIMGLSFDREMLMLSLAGAAIITTVWVMLITEVGVLAFVASIFAFYQIQDMPLVLDTSVWFAGRSIIVAAMLIGVAAWGFYTALAGKSPLGAAFE